MRVEVLSINIDEISSLEVLQNWALKELNKDISECVQAQRELDVLWSFFIGSVNQNTLTIENINAFKNAIKLRSQEHYPIPYLTGECNFSGNRFFISDLSSEHYRQGIKPLEQSNIYKTYVPRNETQWIVQKAAEELKNRSKSTSDLRVVDIATGSGCIAISIKKCCPAVSVTAVDISKEALKVVKRNQNENHVTLHLLQGSWFEPVLSEKFDLVICNPPYVPVDQSQRLSRGAQHEPKQAHHPQESPEDLFKKLYKQTSQVLRTNGIYIFEIGFGQFGSENFDITEVANSYGLTAQIHKDYEGIERFVSGNFFQH